MFLENRLERMARRLREHSPVPMRLQLWNGRCYDLGPQHEVTVTIPKPAALRHFLSPDLGRLGAAYVNGQIDVRGSAEVVFRAAEALVRGAGAMGVGRLGARWHTPWQDRRAIEHHYDVGNDFYALFLDPRMVYSCAYFRHDHDSLESAQLQKLDLILDKLRLQPGERFLDVGCGWGALVMRAAQKYGAQAYGVTLSAQQLQLARERIRQAGLEHCCQVDLLDYRELDSGQRFDKIASVGMFEHVGLRHLASYFGRLTSLLQPHGLLLNHGITTSDVNNRWQGGGAGEFIDRYVFPQGELPHLYLVLQTMAQAGLEALDIESLRRHYALTCSAWLNGLESNSASARQLAGEHRYRVWQMYLAGCAHGFAHGWINLYQILCSRADHPALPQWPMTREHLYRP